MSRETVQNRLRPSEGREGYGELVYLGVAAARMERGSNRWPHAGMLYRWQKEVRLFEMLSHEMLQDEPARPGFVWVEPVLTRQRAVLVAMKCRLVHRLHKSKAVPYGFRYARTTFDAQGILRLGAGEVGVTCSTILAAILHSEGVDLVDPSTWPDADRSEQQARARLIADVAVRDAAHAAVLENEIAAPRISPEDVVAAAALTPPPPPVTWERVLDGSAVVGKRIGL